MSRCFEVLSASLRWPWPQRYVESVPYAADKVTVQVSAWLPQAQFAGYYGESPGQGYFSD